MSLTELELVKDWLLKEGHQCSFTSPGQTCWCKSKKSKQQEIFTTDQPGSLRLEATTKRAGQLELPVTRPSPYEAAIYRQQHSNSITGKPGGTDHDQWRRDTIARLSGQHKQKQRGTLGQDASKSTFSDELVHQSDIQAATKTFELLSLPAEVRTRIYRHYFPPKFYHWYWHSRRIAKENPTWVSFLCSFAYPIALLKTCKTIWSEATPELYKRLVIVLDLRPDRLAGFQLYDAFQTSPRLDLITRIVINLQLEVHYAAYGDHFLDAKRARYEQLSELKCLTRLGLHVCYDENALRIKGLPWYGQQVKSHVKEILRVLNPRVFVEGAARWDVLWYAKEVCSSLVGELRATAMPQRWITNVINEAELELLFEETGSS